MNNLQSWGFSYNPKDYEAKQTKEDFGDTGSEGRINTCANRTIVDNCIQVGTQQDGGPWDFESGPSGVPDNACNYYQEVNSDSGPTKYTKCKVEYGNYRYDNNLFKFYCDNQGEVCEFTDELSDCYIVKTKNSVEKNIEYINGYNCKDEILVRCKLPAQGCGDSYENILVSQGAISSDVFEEWCESGYCELNTIYPNGIFENVYSPDECTSCAAPTSAPTS
jgi:hypothetical protein